MNPGNRIFGLDMMRASAILLVVLSHAMRFSPIPGATQTQLELFMGFIGVELFFALSGFLIGGILLREMQDGISLVKIRKFWARRWMRTLPVYYIVLLCTPLFYLLFFHENPVHFRDILPFLFFVQNFAHPHPEYFGVAWSLSIEEWIYILFPLIWLIYFRRTMKKYQSETIFKFSIFFFLIFELILRLLKVYGQEAEWDAGLRKIVFFRFDAIAFGLLMAYLKMYKSGIFLKKYHFALAGIVLLVISTVIFYKCGAQENKINFMTGEILLPLTGIACAFLLPFAEQWKNYKWKIPGKTIVFISLISYSLYLIHSLVWEIYLIPFNHINPGFMQWLICAGYLAISTVAAVILHYGIEKPFLKLRDRIL
jgi:peptidoglycan/LPS O-acetylase OafA/YrhL